MRAERGCERTDDDVDENLSPIMLDIIMLRPRAIEPKITLREVDN